jgi:hypothetical protein
MAEAYWFGIAILALVGFLVWYYVKQNTPAGTLVRRGLGMLFLLSLIVVAAYELDEVGWIPHHHDTPVFISGAWMIGEFLTCEMQAVTLDRGATYDYFLDCAGREGKPHRLPIRYWGRLERDDVGRLEKHQRLGKWQCQRTEDSLICKALD